MMQKRKLSSLLLISFIVVFAFSSALANTVTFEQKSNIQRCNDVYQNVNVAPAQEITAFEIVFEIKSQSGGAWTTSPASVAWNMANIPTGWYTFMDLSRVDGVDADTVRMAAVRLDPGLSTMAAGDFHIATIGMTTNDVCSGVIEIVDAEWVDYVNPVGPIVTQFSDADANLVTVAVNPNPGDGTVTIVNELPTIDGISNATVHWGDMFTETAVGHDADLPNLCEELTYTLDVYPAGMVIDEASGAITWDVPGDAVCYDGGVTVRVTDLCGDFATTSFTMCVQNDAPNFVACGDAVYDYDEETPPLYIPMCPDDRILVGAGEVAYGQVFGEDPEPNHSTPGTSGPNVLQYTVISFDGEGTVMMDPATGEFEWQTEMDYENPVNFVFTFCVEVTDNANICDPCSPENADTACFEIEVVPVKFIIEKEHGAPQGQMVDIDVKMPDETYINHPMGGFEFLIQYDNSALTMMDVSAGEFIVNCGWEYFTYRTGPFGNCGDGCPSGMIRMVGLAEYNNGDDHPDCFSNYAGDSVVARIKFLVTNDRTYECMFVPIRFIWLDCNDNTVSDVPGEHLFIGRRVFDYYGADGLDSYVEIEPLVTPDAFPTIYGPLDYCDEVTEEGKPPIYEFIDFYNGGVDIRCAKDIDDRGDINLDGVAYSIADAVMFTNYFINGLSAFPDINDNSVDGAIAATDVNADGLTLSVADLVYLIRVIVGDAVPYDNPFVGKEIASIDAKLFYDKDGKLGVGDIEMGAAFVLIEGEVSPELLAPGMEIKSNFDGTNTRVLVFSLEHNGFTGDFLNANGRVVDFELATIDGSPVVAKLLPTEFSLNQNYPNPFNPTTTIGFALPQASDYRLTVFNVTGQIVAEFSGDAEAGWQTIEWDAGNNASGVYFYKLNAGNFSDTKKMVLIK